MIRTLAQIREDVKIAANQADSGTSIDDRVDQIIRDVLARIVGAADPGWEHLRGLHTFQTIEDAGSGLEVSMNQGSKTVTATTGLFTAAMVGRRVIVGTDTTVRTIESVAGGGGSCVVDLAREGENITEAAVKIYQDVYAIPTRCDKIASVQNLTSPKTEEDDGILDYMDPREIRRQYPDRSTTGKPLQYTDVDDDVSAYTTGKAAMSAGGTTITFSNGADLDGAEAEEGMKIRIEDEVFILKSITDATHAETYQPAASAHAATTDYSLEVRIRQIRLRPAPLDIFTFEVAFYRREYGLYADSDVWDGPEKFYHLIKDGATARLMAEMRSANPEGLAEIAKDFRDDLRKSKVDERRKPDDTEKQIRPRIVGVYKEVWNRYGG